MSIGPKEYRAKKLEELGREFRQLHGLSASIFRAAAAQTGKTVTDMQVIEILDSTGPTTAGRLSRQRLVMGRRRSRPKALSEIFGPGAACRR